MNGDEPVGVPWIVLLGFLRISTNPRIFPRPLSLNSTLTKVDAWLAANTIRIICEMEDHWDVLRELLVASGIAGNLTTDTQLAALAISHDSTLVTFDADFARFKGLRRELPAAP